VLTTLRGPDSAAADKPALAKEIMERTQSLLDGIKLEINNKSTDTKVRAQLTQAAGLLRDKYVWLHLPVRCVRVCVYVARGDARVCATLTGIVNVAQIDAAQDHFVGAFAPIGSRSGSGGADCYRTQQASQGLVPHTLLFPFTLLPVYAAQIVLITLNTRTTPRHTIQELINVLIVASLKKRMAASLNQVAAVKRVFAVFQSNQS
jgi:hypothetical protein